MRQRKRLNPWLLLDALFVALVLGAVKLTFHDSQLNDVDFHVYWQAAHRWISGTHPYAYTAADQGFVFKYPPWLLPLFLPIGILSYESARVAWYAIELGCVAYAVRWCISQGVARRLALFMMFVFWWMFHAHFSAGQFTLVLLVACLWAYPRPETRSGAREAVLTYLLSAKVFSLYTLAGIWKRFLKPGPWITGAALFVATHLVLLAMAWKTGTLEGGVTTTLVRIYRDFIAAASSGGAELGATVIRGQGNHGLTALLLRSLHVNSLSFISDMVASGLVMLVLGTLWARFSRKLTEAERWTGWIGAALIAHPLAWHHSFVLAYPLCTLSLARASRTGSRGLIALSTFGACCIGILIPQVIGHTLVRPFELAGGKSWGVVLSAIALVLSAQKRTRVVA